MGGLMAQETGINAEMAKHARAATEMIQAEYGQELDFSEPTIGAIAAILNALWKSGDMPDEFLETASLLFGSYIGETIRHHFNQALWHQAEAATDSGMAFLRVDGIDLFPIGWCHEQLRKGPAESVVGKYMAFREAS
jgi:hypothetical protein